MPLHETKQKLKDILIICSSAIPEGQDRTLVLGELYWRLGDTVSGLEYIKKVLIFYTNVEKKKKLLLTIVMPSRTSQNMDWKIQSPENFLTAS